MGFGGFLFFFLGGGVGLGIVFFSVGRSFTGNWGFQTAIAFYHHTYMCRYFYSNSGERCQFLYFNINRII